MALDTKDRVGTLTPGVGRTARALPRPRFDLIVGEHAEGRNDVLREVLVLVVPPDDHEIWPEFVERPTGTAKVLDQPRAVGGAGGGAAVVTVLTAHRGRPVGGVAIALGQSRILQDGPEDTGHVLIETVERRVVGHAQAQDFAHVVIPPGGRPRAAGSRPRLARMLPHSGPLATRLALSYARPAWGGYRCPCVGLTRAAPASRSLCRRACRSAPMPLRA